ncbi:MAG: tRNA lysidine(34) synthetase TilS [candidate division WOR-3 bacterium]
MKRLSVLHQFLDTVKRHNLLKEKSKLLVGISGGADSVCLLDLLRVVAAKYHLKIFALHINHQLRESAQRDEEFVRRLCKSWGVKLEVVTVDVQGYAKRTKSSIEEAARQLRYYHYQRVARRLRCDTICLGHNADDNLETVVLNLARGAGLRGLAGIPIRRENIVRPLLEIKREAIRGYLKARGIEWVEDETNLDIRFRRNLIRQEIVPLLKKINPGVVENVLRTSRLISEEDLFLDFLASRVLDKIGSFARREAAIDIKEFNGYNNILKRRMLRLLMPELDALSVERALGLIAKGCQGRHQLKAGIEIVVKKDKLKIPLILPRSKNGSC